MRQMELIKTISLLEKHKLPFSKAKLAKNPAQALKFAKELKFPVALKICSTQIIHKTDVGGIKTNIENEEQLLKAYDEIIKSVKKKSPKAKIQGIAVQRMEQGIETIIGTKQDPQFGPVIMFGLGGVFVEVLKDVVFRIAPVDKTEAEKMLEEIKAKQILEGSRGKKPVDKKQLINLLVKTSELVVKNKHIIELDFNPVIVNEKKAVIVDARIMVE